MGSNGSKLVKKIFGPTSHAKEAKDQRPKNPVSSSYVPEDDLNVQSAVARLPSHVGPLVMYRQGSMFFDEDGDLAHEFYVEVKEGRKSKMKRVYENLRPQGTVRLPFPRLHSECPVIMYAL